MEPSTRSRTIPVVTTSSAPASAQIRAAMWTARPARPSDIRSHSPVWTPARTAMPDALAAASIAIAARTARVGPSKIAMTPSPVVLTSSPPAISVKARQSA